jgi:hypothetical protein
LNVRLNFEHANGHDIEERAIERQARSTRRDGVKALSDDVGVAVTGWVEPLCQVDEMHAPERAFGLRDEADHVGRRRSELVVYAGDRTRRSLVLEECSVEQQLGTNVRACPRRAVGQAIPSEQGAEPDLDL